MFEKKKLHNQADHFYEDICLQLDVLLDESQTLIGQLANTSALLNVYLRDINWVGFYIYHNGALHLGPFQGLPACSVIEIGKGVCGMAAEQKKPIIVEDVHQFQGHIACDKASQSEIVIPILIEQHLFGVLDIDSPILARFNEKDLLGLKQVVALIAKKMKYND